jgi:lipoprotein-releasing system ATP-binding protein
MDEAQPLLRVEGVRKTYGARVVTEALKGIDLEFGIGEFCAMTGPSGCGKTTLLNIVGLLDRPTAGRVLLKGRNTGPLEDAERTTLRAQALGFVFQFHHLLMAFTAVENVMMPLLSTHGRAAPWMRDRALELLRQVDLADRATYRVTDLSGGEQQRVAVARALVMRPDLVLADEPTGNLDTKAGERVFELLRRANQEDGTGFLIVTHDEDIARRCDRIVRLVDGRVVEDLRLSAT